jgi:hypothetical protein
MIIDELTIYKIYQGLQLHYFTKSYNAWKYNFAIRINEQQFNQKKEYKFCGVLLGNKELHTMQDYIDYFTSFYITKGKIYITDMLNDDNNIYREFIKKMNTFTYMVKQEFEQIKSLAKEENAIVFDTVIQNRPWLYDKIIYNDISFETICVINILKNEQLFSQWLEKYDDTYLQKMVSLWIKYSIYLKEKFGMKIITSII